MNSYKDETLKQLNIRRSTIASSLHYAKIKLKALTSDQPISTNQATQKNEFSKQVEYCEGELAKIDGCINWIKLIAS